MSQFLKWAAEMDRAASAVELASDGSTECLAIIDGNRAIAEVLRHGAVIEAKLAALVASGDAMVMGEIGYKVIVDKIRFNKFCADLDAAKVQP